MLKQILKNCKSSKWRWVQSNGLSKRPITHLWLGSDSIDIVIVAAESRLAPSSEHDEDAPDSLACKRARDPTQTASASNKAEAAANSSATASPVDLPPSSSQLLDSRMELSLRIEICGLYGEGMANGWPLWNSRALSISAQYLSWMKS